jgi:hypothetical protein
MAKKKDSVVALVPQTIMDLPLPLSVIGAGAGAAWAGGQALELIPMIGDWVDEDGDIPWRGAVVDFTAGTALSLGGVGLYRAFGGKPSTSIAAFFLLMLGVGAGSLFPVARALTEDTVDAALDWVEELLSDLFGDDDEDDSLPAGGASYALPAGGSMARGDYGQMELMPSSY